MIGLIFILSYLAIGVLVGRSLMRYDRRRYVNNEIDEYDPAGAAVTGLLTWPLVVVVYFFYKAFTWRN